MKFLKSLLIASIAVVTISCASHKESRTINYGPDTSYLHNTKVKVKDGAIKMYSLVYVYEIDGKHLGKDEFTCISNDCVLHLDTPLSIRPGKHRLKVEYRRHGHTGTGLVEFTAEPSENYYVYGKEMPEGKKLGIMSGGDYALITVRNSRGQVAGSSRVPIRYASGSPGVDLIQKLIAE